MRFHHFTLGMFAAVATQGNIASALPQGDFGARGEFIAGRDVKSIIDARAAAADLDAAPTADLTSRDALIELAAHGLEKRVPPVPEGLKNLGDWITNLGIIAATCGAGIHFGSLAFLSETQRDCAYRWIADKWTSAVTHINPRYRATAEDVREALHVG